MRRDSKTGTAFDSSLDPAASSPSDVKRHSSLKLATVSSNLPASCRLTVAALSSRNDTVSLPRDLRLPRRATTRRVKRRSTRRVWKRIIADRNIDEFDDDNDLDVNGEEVDFSETDSEHDDEVDGSEESDLEFETELARQMNVSRVRCCCCYCYFYNYYLMVWEHKAVGTKLWS